MSLENYRNERAEALKQELLQQSTELADYCANLIDHSFQKGSVEYQDEITWYFTREGEEIDVRGSSEAIDVRLAKKQMSVERRRFVDPETDEERTAYVVLGDELVADRQDDGLSGPFGVIMFMSRGSSRVEEAIPKCYRQNEERGGEDIRITPEIVGDVLQAFKKEY